MSVTKRRKVFSKSLEVESNCYQVRPTGTEKFTSVSTCNIFTKNVESFILPTKKEGYSDPCKT